MHQLRDLEVGHQGAQPSSLLQPRTKLQAYPGCCRTQFLGAVGLRYCAPVTVSQGHPLPLESAQFLPQSPLHHQSQQWSVVPSQAVKLSCHQLEEALQLTDLRLGPAPVICAALCQQGLHPGLTRDQRVGTSRHLLPPPRTVLHLHFAPQQCQPTRPGLAGIAAHSPVNQHLESSDWWDLEAHRMQWLAPASLSAPPRLLPPERGVLNPLRRASLSSTLLHSLQTHSPLCLDGAGEPAGCRAASEGVQL